jgi:hypothetical protein
VGTLSDSRKGNSSKSGQPNPSKNAENLTVSETGGKPGKPPTQVVKVNPYPIEVQLTRGTQPPCSANIFRLELIGFLMRFEQAYFFIVGDFYECNFKIPAFAKQIKAKCRIIKTYDAVDVH